MDLLPAGLLRKVTGYRSNGMTGWRLSVRYSDTPILRYFFGEIMQRVTGIGGVFFKAQDPVKLKEWYKQHLGLNTDKYGAVFEWREGFDSSKKGYTQWSPFNAKTTYFNPSSKDFMINYRVTNLVQLVDDLKKEGVTVVDSIATVDYGKFVHILDLEGNKLELWEPK